MFMAIGYYGSYFDSAVSPTSTVVPLLIVVAVSMIQEGVADIARHSSDVRTNSSPCLALKRVSFDDIDDIDDVEDESKPIIDGRHLSIELEIDDNDNTNHASNGDHELETLLSSDDVDVEGSGQNQTSSKKVNAFMKEIERANAYPGDIVLIRNRETHLQM